MKVFIISFLFLPFILCDYQKVYDLGDGVAVMEFGYFLTGILVPWIMGLTFCIVSCVFCCIPRKYQLPLRSTAFVSIPQGQFILPPQQFYQAQPVYQQQPYYGYQQGQPVAIGLYGSDPNAVGQNPYVNQNLVNGIPQNEPVK